MEIGTREFIGLVAAGLTVIAFLLPVVRVFQIRSARAMPLPTIMTVSRSSRSSSSRLGGAL